MPDNAESLSRLELGLPALVETVVGIKETVDGHTSELGEIRQEQQRIARTLASHGDQITAIQQTLATIRQRLEQRSP